MSIITKEFLEQIGIELDDEAVARLSEEFEEELYQRVLNEVIELSDEDIVAELHKLAYIDNEDSLKWLQDNIEDFDDIVRSETYIMLGDLAENADLINEEQVAE